MIILMKVNKKINKLLLMKLLFIIYCLFLLYVLFLNRINKNIFCRINLTPFFTINRYIKALKNNNISFYVFFINIIANFILFMPMGIFIPKLFRIRKNFEFLLIMLLVITCIEVIQHFSYTGSADIDDVILNLLGAFISYITMKKTLII